MRNRSLVAFFTPAFVPSAGGFNLTFPDFPMAVTSAELHAAAAEAGSARGSLLTLMHGRVRLEEPCLRVLAKAIVTCDPSTLTAVVVAKEIGLRGSVDHFEEVLRLLLLRRVKGVDAKGRHWVAPLCWGSTDGKSFEINFAPQTWSSFDFMRQVAPMAEELIFLLRAPRQYVIAMYLMLRDLSGKEAARWGTVHPLALSLPEIRRRLGESLGTGPIQEMKQPADFYQYVVAESVRVVNEITDLRVRCAVTRGAHDSINEVLFYLDGIASPQTIFPLIPLDEDPSFLPSRIVPRSATGAGRKPLSDKSSSAAASAGAPKLPAKPRRRTGAAVAA